MTIRWHGIVLIGVMSLVCAVIGAEVENASRRSKAKAQESGPSIDVRKSRESSSLVRVNTFIGDGVVNEKGEGVGQLEELIIDPKSGRIVYAVLSFGDFVGLDNKIFVVPWDKLSFDADREKLVFAFSEEELEDAPGFYDYYNGDVNNPEWVEEVRKYYKLGPDWWVIP